MLDPLVIVGSLYAKKLIDDATLRDVTISEGVINATKAHRLLQSCKQNILSDQDPDNRLTEFMGILRISQPAAKPVVDGIMEHVSSGDLHCNVSEKQS